MDDISTIYGIQKLLKDGIQRNTDTLLSGNIDSLEKYQYILGQKNTHQDLNWLLLARVCDKSTQWRAKIRRLRYAVEG